MTRFTDRVTRDLHQIADRSTPSSTAWDSIRTRIDEQTDQPTVEVIMLSPDRNDQPKRGWMLAAAAVAGLALVGGLVFATTRSDDDTVPADTPTATLPAEPAPDAEVDPDADAAVVPAPDPTTAAEVAAEPEPVPEPATVTVTGTFSTEDVVATTAANSSGLVGEAGWQATTVFEGQMAGAAPGIWQTWDLAPGGGPPGGELRVGEHVFTGTIDGLGSGTLTYTAEWLTTDTATGKAAITGGTGDFEGAYGSAVLEPVPAAPGDSSAGTYSWDITVPPKGSLVTVTATGTAPVSIARNSDTDGTWTGTGGFSGSIVGGFPARGSGTNWWNGGDFTFGTSRWEFTGTIDGLGTGTITFDRIGFFPVNDGTWTWFDVVVDGTDELVGITGTGQVAADESYTYTLTAPVNQ